MNNNDFNNNIVPFLSLNRNKCRTIAVTSGKGGVGKTNFTANLAISLAEENKKVLAVDCDMGLSNLDIVFGIVSEYTLKEVLFKNLPINEAIVSTKFGVDVLPASAGDEDLANLSPTKKLSFFEVLNSLKGEYDYIILDTGAGVHSNVTSIASTSDFIVLITTGEPTAISSAYAMIKILRENHNVEQLGIVINFAASGREGLKTFEMMTSLTERFLSMTNIYLGHIYQDSSVPKAVQNTYPLLKFYPKSPSAMCIKAISAKIKKFVAKNNRSGTHGKTKSEGASWI